MTKRAAAVAALGLAALWQVADACGPELILRPALQGRFWQPSVRRASQVLGEDGRPRASESAALPYAGMGASASPLLWKAQMAYQDVARWRIEQVGWWSEEEGTHLDGAMPRKLAAVAREAVKAALAAHPPAAEAEELRLIDAKVTLREADSLLRGFHQEEQGYAERKRAAFEKARTELQAFLAGAPTPALASEARGWLARCHYVLGEPHAAAHIYLEELARHDSAIDREALLRSIDMVFPYNGSAAGLSEHLDQYFDTPQHALLAVTLVTNPVVGDEEERKAMAAVGRRVLTALERHRELFSKGDDSARLALASMRASLYLGDPERALAIAGALPPDAKVLAEPETRWMRGLAHFLLKQYAEAEPDLAAVAGSPGAPVEPRERAALGLLAVYQKLGRPVDQLLAALRFESSRHGGAYMFEERHVSWAPFGSALIDVAYLLDVQLSDDALESARARLAKGPPLTFDGDIGVRPALDYVDYARAVRAARREDYAAAAAIFDRLAAGERAARMREAARVHDAIAKRGGPALAQRVAYAAFLDEHSDEVFFNDSVWRGLQREAFLRNTWGEGVPDPIPPLLGDGERKALLENERRFQDAQEEKWRAFQVLDQVVQEAGQTRLGRRAAVKALEVVRDLLDNPRFGRETELRAARKRLNAWLLEKPKAGHPVPPT